MALVNAVTIAQAAAFTLGCAVLDTRRFDQERLGAALTAVAGILLLVLLIAVTAGAGLDALGIDPDNVFTLLD